MSAFSSVLASPGCQLSEMVTHTTCLLHGTSLSLISIVSTFLSDYFSTIDPENDHEKWASRDNMEVYYFLLSDVISYPPTPMCAVRTIVDRNSSFDYSPSNQPLRVVIDYTYTANEYRGRGLATIACNYVLNAAKIANASSYVLALEESCPWWMEKYGFTLEESKLLNSRFNVFPDTHLLRVQQSDDFADCGHAQDILLKVEFEDSDGDDDNPSRGNNVPPEFTTALSLLTSLPTPEQRKAISRLRTILNNILAPTINPKHRKISSSNAVIQEVLAVHGCFDLLTASGWVITDNEEGRGEGLTLLFSGEPENWLREAVAAMMN